MCSKFFDLKDKDGEIFLFLAKTLSNNKIIMKTA